MQSLRNIALGICILCSVGGVVQIFWPDNSYKPVINTVIVLYIITSALQMRGLDRWRTPQLDLAGLPDSTDFSEYQAYAGELTLDASVQALETLLAEQGIDAEVTMEESLCCVYLQDSSDSVLAEQILQDNCGALPYEILSGGEES